MHGPQKPGTHMAEMSQLERPKAFGLQGLRCGRWMIGLVMGLAFTLVVPLLSVIQISLRNPPTAGKVQSDNVRVIFAIIFVFGLFNSYRLLRIRAVIAADGLTMFNPFSTHRVRWVDISTIRIESRRIEGDEVTRIRVIADTSWNIAAAMGAWSRRHTALKPLLDACAEYGVRVEGLEQ